MMGPVVRRAMRGSFLPGELLYGGGGTSSGGPNAPDRGGDTPNYNDPHDYPAGWFHGDGYGYDNNPYPSSGGSGGAGGNNGGGNDAGWSTGIQDAFYAVQDDPYKGRLRDRIAPYIRKGSSDMYGGMAGTGGAYAP